MEEHPRLYLIIQHMAIFSENTHTCSAGLMQRTVIELFLYYYYTIEGVMEFHSLAEYNAELKLLFAIFVKYMKKKYTVSF